MTGHVFVAVPIVVVENFKLLLRIHKFKVNNFARSKLLFLEGAVRFKGGNYPIRNDIIPSLR